MPRELTAHLELAAKACRFHRSLVLLLAIFALIPPRTNAQRLDLIIRGGSLIDGSGSPAIQADIGIAGDRIVFVGASAGRTAKRTIDATGLIVTPGFIDPHTHTADDLSDPKRSRNQPYLMQGVTTVATGNDGASPKDIGATLAQWHQCGPLHRAGNGTPRCDGHVRCHAHARPDGPHEGPCRPRDE
jgi:hypothetical protein